VGRNAAAIGITAGGAEDTDGVRRLADLGVTRTVIANMGGRPEHWKSRLGGFADRAISRVD
jgi:hypothetical protein